MAVAYPSKLAGKPIKVYMQTQDGVVYDLTGFVTDVSVLQSYGDYVETELRIHAVNAEFRGTVLGETPSYLEQFQSAVEWRCDYCGHVNPRTARFCGQLDDGSGCHAARPFLYE